jgi:tripartite ATP-independent transporter DctM subunit
MDGIWIVLLTVLAILGAPLFAIFGAASMLLFGALPDTSITGTANDVFSEKFADSPLLVTIPLFTFAGYLMAESGTPQRLVRLSRAWLGWMPGGLAMVCLVASAFFTTFTGGSGITIVAIGGLLYPALVQDKYDENFSLGLVTTGGSLGLLFPPSVPMIIYGVVAGIMIEKLFLAGLIPGIITVATLAIYSSMTGIKHKMPRTSFNRTEAVKTLWEAKWEALLPVALLGGMYSGLLRIHEAAAFTAIYTLVIEVWIYRDVSFRRDLPRIIRESMTLVGAILAILATAIGFTAFLIQARVPMVILDAMEGYITSQVMFLIALNFFLIGVGMLMDIFSAIVVVVPLIVPIALRFGVDPYHLGIVFLLNLEIGYMTPPVGLNLFISSFRFNKPITQLYRSVLPFIGLLGLALIIVTYIPALSTWLPNMLESQAVSLDEPMEGIDDGDPSLDLDALEDDDELDLDALEAADDELDLDALEGDEELDLDALEDDGDDFGVLDDE